jgi:hypothetical protein
MTATLGGRSDRQHAPSLSRYDMKVKQNWLKVKRVGMNSNRSCDWSVSPGGLRHKVQPWVVCSQSRYCSCNDPRQRFGVGASTQVDTEVRWPDGGHVQCKKVAANQLITIREGIRDCEQPGVETFPEFVVVSHGHAGKPRLPSGDAAGLSPMVSGRKSS